jgi:hypothetical protein
MRVLSPEFAKSVAAPALVAVLLNAFKPIHVDDMEYIVYARQVAKHPLDPYGFSLLYFAQSTPANHMLIPPFQLYWCAVAIALFGERVLLWKLWLLPECLALAASVWYLARRFARGLEAPLVWLTVFSPAIIPGINLAMPDIPALALGVLGLALFIRATDDDSSFLAALAGLAAGLAVQTKYTGFVGLAAIMLYAVMTHRPRVGVVAVIVAAAVFIGWEIFIAASYGESHFLYHLGKHGNQFVPKSDLMVPFLVYLGGLAPGLILLGLAALRFRGVSVAVVATAIACGYAVIAYGPITRFDARTIATNPERGAVSWCGLIFGVQGLIILGLLAAAIKGIWRGKENDAPGRRRDAYFLILWLGLEVAGCFILSPFAAARRLIGVIVASTLLLGSWAARVGVRPAMMSAITVFGVASGIMYYLVDLHEAKVEEKAADEAAQWIRQRDPNATIWYVGYWGFQFYAEKAGMREIVRLGPISRPVPPGARAIAPLQPTMLHRGDWVVAPHAEYQSLPRPAGDSGPQAIEVVERLRFGDDLPLATIECYYGGQGGMTPLQHHQGPRVIVRIARVLRDFIPVYGR